MLASELIIINPYMNKIPGRVGQSITCLAADQGVGSSIPALSHTLVEIDQEIISTAILPPLIQEGLLLVMHKVLVNL